jgi:hypothetical protein
MYALKRKSNTLEALKMYQAWVKRKFGQGIGIFRSDPGGEFTGHDFDAFLAAEGIERQMGAPRSPQQNGQAECFQQTIVNKAEAMRHAAGLSSGFWKLAIEAAIHTYNVQPSSVQNWKTPDEIWEGEKPDVSHLRTFGCLAYVHVHKKKRVKTDPKSKSMIFVGYEPGTKAWRFWDPEAHTVVVLRDAQFDETVFPRRPPPTLTNPGAPLGLPESEEPAPEPPETEPAGEAKQDQTPSEPLRQENPATQSAPAPKPKRAKAAPTPRSPYPKQGNAGIPVPRFADEDWGPHGRPAGPQEQQHQDVSNTESDGYASDTAEHIKQHLLDEVANAEASYAYVSAFTSMTDMAQSISGAPLTHKEAMSRPDADKWVEAMQKEMAALKRRNVWSLADLPKDRKPIHGWWVYAIKHDGQDKA